MARKTIIVVWLVALAFAPFCPVEAQQPKKIPRIGWLGAARTSSPRIEAFRQGLHELGYAEGKNIAIEYRLQRERTIGYVSSPPSNQPARYD